jgi:uncharacterized protein YbaP (TraB family)
MKKHAVIFCLIIIFQMGNISAQSSIWKVEKDGFTMYLGGTIHVLSQDDLPLPSIYGELLAEVDILVFETDVLAAQGTEFQQSLASQVLIEGGKDLSDFLSSETLERLENYFSEQGIDLAMFMGIKPSLISITITTLELQKLGISSPGVEMLLIEQAQNLGLEMDELESIETQLEYLLTMGAGIEDEMMNSTLDDLESLPDQMDLIVDAWRTGELSELEETLIQAMIDETPEVYESLLVERNLSWMPKIRDFAQTDEIEFILVGTAHLIGEQGLLELLKAEGFSLEQL